MWIRKFRLELTGGVTKTFKDLRMDFIYHEIFSLGDLTNQADTFDIEVFNLSVSSFKELVTKDEVRIKFYAGYGDEAELDLVFEGVVVNVIGRRAIPEHITTLYCIPKGLAKANKKIKVIGSREDTVRTFVDKMAAELGLSTEFEAVDDVIDIPYRAKTAHGVGITELTELGKQFYFMPRLESDKLRIITLPEAGKIEKINTVHVLEAELIRGVPRASVDKLTIPYAMNTRIRTGDVIDTTQLRGSINNSLTGGIGDPNGIIDVSGLGKGSLHYSDTIYKWAILPKYQIIYALHKGSNYTDEYVSQYQCETYINNQKGIK